MENVSFYLKRYFNKVANLYGEEVAVESALEKKNITKSMLDKYDMGESVLVNQDMAESLSYYDNTFNDISGLDIMKEMIINAIIFEDDRKYSSYYINKMVSEEKLEDLLFDITNNIVLKRDMVKNYIYNMNRKPVDISDDKNELIKYVMNYKEKEKEAVLCK